MNRRDVLKFASIVAIPGTAFADCRDDKGMINPDFEDYACHMLTLNQAVVVDTEKSGRGVHPVTGKATFGFGNYEKLLDAQHDKGTFPFEFGGMKYRMRVARLSIDVNRHLGCVVCDVWGRVFT